MKKTKYERIEALWNKAKNNLKYEAFIAWIAGMYGGFQAVISFDRKITHKDIDSWEKSLEKEIGEAKKNV